MLDQLKIAWAAGIIDGEGHIRIKPGNLVLEVSVDNTDPRMLTRLKDIFGGSIRLRTEKSAPRHKPIWTWCVGAKSAERTLNRVLPFLVCKADQAEIGLASRRFVKPGGNTSQESSVNRSNRLRLKRELSALRVVNGEGL